MWKMPEIILISRGNSEFPTGLLLQVWTWVVYSVPHKTLSEGLRYLDLVSAAQGRKKSPRTQIDAGMDSGRECK